MADAFADFNKKEKSRERIGKIIVLIISIINFVTAANNFVAKYTSIVNLDIDFEIVMTIINVILTVLFMCGFDWVRIWFGALMAWNAIWTAFGFFVTIRDVPWWINVACVLLIIYYTAAAILLFASRSVKEYLYVRKNG